MGTFDKFDKDEMMEKMKSKVSSATQAIKDKTTEVKTNIDNMKAEKAGNAEQLKEEMLNAIASGNKGIGLFFGRFKIIFNHFFACNPHK